MREHHPFGSSCGATSIIEAGEIIVLHLLIDTLLHMRALAHYILVVCHARGCLITGKDKGLNCWEGIPARSIGSEGLVYH